MLSVKVFEFNPVRENTYLIYNEFNECAIIDPGCYGDEEEGEIAAFITAQKLKPVLLLNTHCHLDHVFGNKFIAEKYHLTLHFHPAERPVFDFAPASGLMYQLPFDNYQGGVIDLVPGQSLKLGSDELALLFTPGHSPGSVSFYSKAENFVISGDALFQGSIGRTDLPLGDHDQLIAAIKKELLILPDDTIVYPGHGGTTTIGEEKRSNPFLVH